MDHIILTYFHLPSGVLLAGQTFVISPSRSSLSSFFRALVTGSLPDPPPFTDCCERPQEAGDAVNF